MHEHPQVLAECHYIDFKKLGRQVPTKADDGSLHRVHDLRWPAVFKAVHYRRIYLIDIFNENPARHTVMQKE